MSQEVPMGDILFGVAVLVVFLIVALVVGRFLSAFKNRRFTQAWSPLVPVINGKIVHDGGGAATSWLTGNYGGKSVQASMIPDRNLYQEEGGSRYNYFDVALVDLPGKQNWRIEYKTPVMGLGANGWQIKAEDSNLDLRLQQSGVVDMLARFGTPTIEYMARTRTLRYSEDITPRWVPTPERFQEELEVLLLLATINADANGG